MAELNLKVTTTVQGADRLRNLAGDIGKVAAGATAALAGVAVFTSGFASDLNESMSKVGVVFGDNADDIKAWAKSAAKSMGISEQAALESAGTFGNLFTAMEIGQGPAADMSTELVELASDLASFNNIDPAEALEKLRAGIVGEAEPLRTLGVNISAAATAQKALELGLVGVGEELTPAIKAQANYALILEQTSTAQGDFERTSGGMANQQRTLAATFQDTMASLGQAFVPIIESLLPQVTAGLQAFGGWVTDNMPTIKEVIGNVMTGIGAAISFVFTEVVPRLIEVFSSLFGAVQSNMPTISGIISTVFDTISKVVGFVTVNILPGLIAAFSAVVGWVQGNWPTISSIFSQVFGAITAVVEAVWPLLESIATVLFPLIGDAATILFNALDGAFKLIGGIFEVATRAWRILFDNIFKPLADGFTAAIDVIRGIWNAFVGFWNGIEISVPSIEVPLLGTVGGFSVGLPDLPRLAKGGIVDGPTLALIGERGPEAVVPLNRAGAMSETHIHLTVMGDLKAEERTLPSILSRAVFASGLVEPV